MPDTSFYIHHKNKLEDVNPGSLLGDPHTDFVVLVPMVVVDELDRLKETKDKQTRLRAGYTLAVLDRLFKDEMVRGEAPQGRNGLGTQGCSTGRRVDRVALRAARPHATAYQRR
jgi:PIN domain